MYNVSGFDTKMLWTGPKKIRSVKKKMYMCERCSIFMNVMVNNFRNNSYFADTLDSVWEFKLVMENMFSQQKV